MTEFIFQWIVCVLLISLAISLAIDIEHAIDGTFDDWDGPDGDAH